MIKSHNSHTYWLVNKTDNNSKQVANNVKKILAKDGWILSKTSPQYLIVVGGDGTFVRFLRHYYNTNIKILCVNSGTVGFYSTINKNNLNSILHLIKDESNFCHPQLLQVFINDKICYNAMNEIVIQSLNTISLDIEINGILYEKYKGTGVLVSTRTGSTGQAKSNGGAIIFPDVNTIQLVEMAPTNHNKHHCFNSPTILNDTATIRYSNIFSSQRSDLIIDGMLVKMLSPNDVIVIRKQEASFFLCFNNKIKDHINKLQKTFIKD